MKSLLSGWVAVIALAFLISSQTAFADPNLVGWWEFDEGSGSTAYDLTGSNNGTITGAAWYDDPCRGMCLSFDGSDDYVSVGNTVTHNLAKGSFTAWVYPVSLSSTCGGYNFAWVIGADNYTGGELGFRVNGNGSGWATVQNTVSGNLSFPAGSITVGRWHLVAMTWDGSYWKLYINDVQKDSKSFSQGTSNATNTTLIGSGWSGGCPWNGKIDDVRFYDKVLSAGEIWHLYREGLLPKASYPNPNDGTIGIVLNTVLSWSPGKDATSHDVYFGTNYNDVNNANKSSIEYVGNFDVNSLDPCGLDIETTYYWRIDEVNGPNLWKGDVWSFRTVFHLCVPSEYSTIQAAIDMAQKGDIVIVAPGTYTGTGNWDVNFIGKAITVRSENGPIDCIIDCNDITGYYPDGYHPIFNPHYGFLFQNGEDANSILDGFTITRSPRSAISCESSSPTITNCVITKNTGQFDGGIRCSDGSPLIINCIISANIGSGICCEYNSSPKITGCTITGNTGWDSRSGRGGGIYARDGAPIITNCTISDNHVSGMGGAIYCNYYSGGSSTYNDLKITNCVITGNSSLYDGGAIYCYGGSLLRTIISNSTISGNSAKRNGGGIYLYSTSPLSLVNSIIWDNNDVTGKGQSAQIYSGKPNAWYSCIQDDNPDDVNIPFGEDIGNIDDDPCFVNTGIKYWDNNSTPTINDDVWVWLDSDYHLLPGSSCIEAGNPSYTYHPGNIDMDGQPRIMGRFVDIGADEFELSAIVVTKPQGGEVWAAGSTHKIEWDSNNVTGAVDIFYSINNGSNWVKINTVADTGSFNWLLPRTVDSNQCLVSVEPNTPVANLLSIESGLFTIKPYRPPSTVPWWPIYTPDKIGPHLGCVKWKFQTDGPVTAGVAIGFNNNIHIPCEDGKLYTLSSAGSLVWAYDTNSPLVSSPAVDRRGNVYFGAENGKLYALDRNGCLLWTHTTDGPIYSSPIVSPDADDPPRPRIGPGGPLEQPIRIFVCSLDGTLYALAGNGSELWSFDTDGAGVASGAIFASPEIGPDGTVYIAGLYDPNLYALDSANGSVKWNCTLLDPCAPNDPKLRPFASPTLAPDGTIYQTLLYNHKRLIETPGNHTPYWYDSKLYAIDSYNGNIMWTTNMTATATQEEQPSPPFPPEPNYLFRKYYAYLRQMSIPPYPYTETMIGGRDVIRYYRVSNSSWSKSALAPDGTIYVSFNDQYLRAVDPNGSIKWVTSLGWFGGFTMTVGGDGLIYAASDDGFLYVVDPDGKEIARFKGDNWLSFPVITADNTIIVSDTNNTVWAIGNNNCEGQIAALHRPEDLNADWSINLTDFAAMADCWLDCTDTSYHPVAKTPYCTDQLNEIFLFGDINRDQYVDSDDLIDLANQWLTQE